MPLLIGTPPVSAETRLSRLLFPRKTSATKMTECVAGPRKLVCVRRETGIKLRSIHSTPETAALLPVRYTPKRGQQNQDCHKRSETADLPVASANRAATAADKVHPTVGGRGATPFTTASPAHVSASPPSCRSHRRVIPLTTPSSCPAACRDRPGHGGASMRPAPRPGPRHCPSHSISRAVPPPPAYAARRRGGTKRSPA